MTRAEQRILAAVKRALEPLNSPELGWPEYYRRLQAAPDRVLHELRESEVLFRTSEQADWPLLVEAFSKRPYTLTLRTQLTIGGQLFSYDQQVDSPQAYNVLPRELAIHIGKRAVRATLEAVAEPYFGEAVWQVETALKNHLASGTEAQRATTVEQGVVHDGPTAESGDAKVQRHDPSHTPE